MTQTRSPAELRSMFGANLRTLAKNYPSISELSRQLGVNRTQFNRYLAGESFPRPDVLSRICNFFGVDARILLEPVAEISQGDALLLGNTLRDFVGAGASNVPSSYFPSGFYKFSRRSFVDPEKFIVNVIYVFRVKDGTYLRGYETKEALEIQNLPVDRLAREFRGIIMQHEDGVSSLTSRHNGMTASFNFLVREASFENNFWVGYVTRTARETMTAKRMERMVWEHLGPSWRDARAAVKAAGFCDEAGLPAYHRRLLRPKEPFQ